MKKQNYHYAIGTENAGLFIVEINTQSSTFNNKKQFLNGKDVRTVRELPNGKLICSGWQNNKSEYYTIDFQSWTETRLCDGKS